jgi:phytoene dehydrogenase-like protein
MNKHKVIVIGGGISGLAACVRLLESGIRDILLVEANSNLGGRIRTIPFRN